jgi:demethylmenaquinone methyltransferase/2-methoxy-6-polyprenyl-1,4-benzoquinol methylase
LRRFIAIPLSRQQKAVNIREKILEKTMTETRETFDGFMGGKVYDIVARCTGYGPEFYRRAAMSIPVRPGMTLLDLGCGTASLSLALAERMNGQGRITGIDTSARQLERAREKIVSSPVTIELRNASVRALPFENSAVDGICMCQVLHALPEDVRADMLTESSRVLKKGGFFALVDWSRPRIGYAAAVWAPSLLGSRHTHNWQGTYPEVFEPMGFHLSTDVYLDSLNRCQVFVKG